MCGYFSESSGPETPVGGDNIIFENFYAYDDLVEISSVLSSSPLWPFSSKHSSI